MGLVPVSGVYARFLFCYWWDPQSQTGYQNFVIGRVALVPFVVAHTYYIDQFILPLRAGSASGNNFRACIYADNGDTPVGGKLMVDSGQFTGKYPYNPDVAPLTPSITLANQVRLDAGQYWVGAQSDSAVPAFSRNNSFAGGTDCVAVNSLPASFLGSYYDNPGGFGAFQNPCPAVTQDPNYSIVLTIRVAKAV